jgi:hypothetical protein
MALAEPDDLSPMLTIRGRKAATEWLNAKGIPLPFNVVRAAVVDRSLPATKIGKAYYFSTSDLWGWARRLYAPVGGTRR